MRIKKLLSAVCVIAMLSSNAVMAQTAEEVSQTDETAVVSAEQADAAADDAEIELMTSLFDGGDGTEQNPYLISTESQLAFITDLPSKHFKLTADIALANDWISIGQYSEVFSGTLDGAGHKVTNMKVTDGYGFMSSITGTVKNLTVEGEANGSDTKRVGGIAAANSGIIENCNFNGNVSSSTDAGGLLGYNSGEVKNCHSSGTITGKNYTGGLIGYSEGGSITNCSSSAEVESTGSNCGGLIGNAQNTTIEKCYATGNSSSSGSRTSSGGLIGYASNATIEKCYATGNSSGNRKGSSSNSGGLVGYIGNATTIKNCYAIGNSSSSDSYNDSYINANQYINSGGLVGYIYGGGTTMTNCYAIGEVTGYRKGGILGSYYSSKPTVTSSYYDSLTTGCTDTGRGTPKTTTGMKNQIIYDGWDFDETWGLDANINNGYPYLLWSADNGGTGGSGSESGVNITGVSLSQNDAVMGVGNVLTLKADVSGENTDNVTLTWSSTNANVASVENGVVTAKAVGSAVISVSAGTYSAACNVTVMDNSVKVTGITLNRTSLDLVINEATTLNATVLPSDATNKSVTWQNLNPEVVSFDQTTGEVKGLAVGTARIRATTSDGGYTADCEINVYDDSVKVTSVELDKYETGIGIGEQVTLKAKVIPENATNKNIKWESLNSSVATVSENGVVTGISEGTTQIYATSTSNSACYAICKITVAKSKVPVTGIELDSNVFGDAFEVDIGKKLVFSPTIKPNNATNKEIKWTSSDSSIATVENGVVTGVSAGTVTITVTTVDGGYSAKTMVKVCEPIVYVTGIEVNKEQVSVPVKGTVQIQAAVLPTNATEQSIKFESNNNAIATVSSEGVITGISQGTTLIKAISETSAGRYVGFCTVTVTKPVVAATSIKLNKGSMEIVEGKTLPLKAVIKPANVTNKSIIWSVGDESVATVSQDGSVTARGVGETVVSVTTDNGISTQCNIKVLSADTPAQLKVEDATVKAGKEVPITVSIAANPGISSFIFDLKYDNTKVYPVYYELGDVLKGVTIQSLLNEGKENSTESFKDKSQVRFLCMTQDYKNMNIDGDMIKITFKTLSDAEMGKTEIEIVPSSFIDQNNEDMTLQSDNCSLDITDYMIGDVNNDDVVDLKDTMVLARAILSGELSEQGKKAAMSIYPYKEGTSELTHLNRCLVHLFRYLSDWQVELGKE